MKRIRSLDLARGFTVLFIPAIHTGMLYSQFAVHHSVIGRFLICIAEGPGGQLLMLLMGVSFAFKSEHRFKTVFAKAVILLAAGYLLNILKFIWPYEFGWLPTEILSELGVNKDEPVPLQLFAIGDILHFSAIATLMLYIVHKQKNFVVLSLILSVIIIVASPLLWDLYTKSPKLNYILLLIGGQPPQMFFPLFPWLVYPLTGLAIGNYLEINERRTNIIACIIGVILIVIGLVAARLYPQDNSAGFYRTSPADTTWHLGVVMLTIFLWFWISKCAKDNLLFDLLIYSSKNITSIYCVQWVMICWILPIVGFRRLDLPYSIIMMVIMTVNTYAIVYIFQHLKSRHAK
ncbi:MAG TPA: heparan-alpha-glucosaminide N-acetyltransferase domain-containing protein [Niabella sp.]|nr:heparan-alpha-glucosaminide N-acetyltransferase domain-containing protein [Niabella sp.]